MNVFNKIKKTLIFIFISLIHLLLLGQNSKTDSLENLLQKHQQQDTIRINLLLDIANIQYNSETEKALAYAEEANKISKTLSYPKGESESFRLLGICNFYKSNYPLAYEYYNKALEISQKYNLKNLTAKNYNNIGFLYWKQGNYDDAVIYADKALKLNQELNNLKEIAWCLINIGGLEFSQQNYAEALDYYLQAVDVSTYIDNKIVLANSLKSLALIYINDKEFDKAIKYLNEVIDICKITKNKFDLAQSYLYYGNLYFIQKKYSLALEYTNKSLRIADESDFFDLLMKIHKQLADIYAATNNYKKAYENHLIYKSISDSIFTANNLQKITVKEYQFQFEKEKKILELEQQKKEELNKKEQERQKSLRNAYLIGLILTSIFLIGMIISLIKNKKANALLTIQKKEIEEKNAELFVQQQDIVEKSEELKTIIQELNEKNDYISGSIRYANKIQQTILPIKEELDKVFDLFIIFRPKDVVSGDFYWYSKTKNYYAGDRQYPYFFAVSDCTGHGVPGAFMSMIGNTLLNEIVNEKQIYDSKEILSELDKQLVNNLHQDKREDINGMDISLCKFEFETNKCKLTFSGAKRYIFIYKRETGKIEIIKGDIKSVGGILSRNKIDFTNKEITLESGDILYLFSDGLFDQNNNERKSFGKTNTLNLLIRNIDKPTNEQKAILEKELDKWQGDEFQRDDITFVGIKF